MNWADFVFHHLSGAIFGVGLVSAWLGNRWAKEATKTLNEASAYYERVSAEAKARTAARDLLSESDSGAPK